jgi:hypothetical protein
LAGSVDDISPTDRDPYRPQDVSTSEGDIVITPEFHGTRTNALAAAGVRVHVSDASPRGFSGRVTAVHADALTVARDDTGAWS